MRQLMRDSRYVAASRCGDEQQLIGGEWCLGLTVHGALRFAEFSSQYRCWHAPADLQFSCDQHACAQLPSCASHG